MGRSIVLLLVLHGRTFSYKSHFWTITRPCKASAWRLRPCHTGNAQLTQISRGLNSVHAWAFLCKTHKCMHSGPRWSLTHLPSAAGRLLLTCARKGKMNNSSHQIYFMLRKSFKKKKRTAIKLVKWGQ